MGSGDIVQHLNDLKVREVTQFEIISEDPVVGLFLKEERIGRVFDFLQEAKGFSRPVFLSNMEDWSLNGVKHGGLRVVFEPLDAGRRRR